MKDRTDSRDAKKECSRMAQTKKNTKKLYKNALRPHCLVVALLPCSSERQTEGPRVKDTADRYEEQQLRGTPM